MFLTIYCCRPICCQYSEQTTKSGFPIMPRILSTDAVLMPAIYLYATRQMFLTIYCCRLSIAAPSTCWQIFSKLAVCIMSDSRQPPSCLHFLNYILLQAQCSEQTTQSGFPMMPRVLLTDSVLMPYLYSHSHLSICMPHDK